MYVYIIYIIYPIYNIIYITYIIYKKYIQNILKLYMFHLYMWQEKFFYNMFDHLLTNIINMSYTNIEI